MTVKITSTQFEALVLASETPVPIPLDKDAALKPINPMLFPHDWSLECTLETVWQTDVTESIDQHQDRWMLLARPLRKQTARLVGHDKATAYALLQSLQAGSSQFGYPVPIFCDQVEIDRIVEDGALFRIYGDFSRRRFFRGGRVVFLPNTVDPLQSRESASFAQVVQVAPGQLTVFFDQGTVRPPVSSDTVFPCMDVETLESASGVALTDSVYTVEVTWTEVEGQCSLPASWPAVTAEDSSGLSPFCTIVGGYALFPFDPDWSEGVDISAKRRIESNKLGRTSVQDPSGKSFLEFAITVMGYNRELSWDVVRFFDAMRGRGGLFVLEHPLKPWQFVSTSGAGSARFIGSSNPTSMLSLTGKALVTLENGNKELVTVTSLTELSGGVFQVGWSESIAGDVADIQPAYICRFDTDALRESWATDSVIPNMELVIVEDPQQGAAVAISPTLGYTQAFTSLSAVEGLFLLLRAGSYCTDLTGRPVRAYPNVPNRVHYWKHSGEEEINAGLKGLKVCFDNSPSTALNRLVLPLPLTRNNGQPYLLNPKSQMSFMLDSSLPVGDRQPWSVEDGWTCFFCITPFTFPVSPRDIQMIEVVSPEFSLGLLIDSTSGTGASRGKLTYNGGSSAIPFNYTASGSLSPSIVALRLGGTSESNSARVWIDGVPCINSGAVISLSNASSFSRAALFDGSNNGTLVSPSAISTQWGSNPGASAAALYKRALTVEEMNLVTSKLAGLFLSPATPIVLY